MMGNYMLNPVYERHVRVKPVLGSPIHALVISKDKSTPIEFQTGENMVRAFFKNQSAEIKGVKDDHFKDEPDLIIDISY